IQHREFYELFAFFNNTTDVNNRGAAVQIVRGEVFGQPIPTVGNALRGVPPAADPIELARQQGDWERAETARLKKLGEAGEADPLLAALRLPAEERSEEQTKLVADAFAKFTGSAAAAKRAPRNPDIADVMVMKELE